MQLILASASPRRKELLSLFGLPFVVRAADIDETMDFSEPPFDEVARVSRAMALAVAREEDDAVMAGCWASPTAGRRPSPCFPCCPAGIIR